MHRSFPGLQLVEDVSLDHSCVAGRATFEASPEGSPEQRDIIWAAGVGVAVGEPASHPEVASQSQAGVDMLGESLMEKGWVFFIIFIANVLPHPNLTADS